MISTIGKIQQACHASGMSLSMLFEKPLPDIITFARFNNIPLNELKEICILMIERLDALDLRLFEPAR